MFNYPQGMYTDIRIEETSTANIQFDKLDLIEERVKSEIGVFVRIYDGKRWYYSSFTDVDLIQEHIDKLARMAKPNSKIIENPIYKRFQVYEDTSIRYYNGSPNGELLSSIPIEQKRELLLTELKKIKDDTIVNFTGFYTENYTIKSLFSSKGTKLKFDKQSCGMGIRIELSYGDNKERASVSKGTTTFEELKKTIPAFQESINKSVDFVKNAVDVKPGMYPVLLSPEATGVFAHESFGHKSEADFMVGDETMKAEWTMGKKVASELVTIIDNGTIVGNGYVPYDDEGTKGSRTNLITKGVLTGRLHSSETAAILNEENTGNARSIGFEYEPIVRMSTTYIEKGHTPLKELIAEMDNAIFVETIRHGSGMSTFTIAPERAYLIENGKITKPVKISVITGSVFETLMEIDGISEEFELKEFVGGGCGKFEQWPLPVGFGGPYTRVRKLKVQ